MLNQISYTLKKYARNKEGLLFGILFPIAFGLIYVFALGNLVNGDIDFEPISVAVVDQTTNPAVDGFFKQVGTEGKIQAGKLSAEKSSSDRPNIQYIKADIDEAQKYFKDNAVNYIVEINEKNKMLSMNIQLKSSSVDSINSKILYQTIKSFSGIHNVTVNTMSEPSIPLSRMAELPKIMESAGQESVVTRINNKKTSGSSNYFYACLGYICIFFMSVGVQVVFMNQANFSTVALREEVSPKSKFTRSALTFFTFYVISLIVTMVVYGIFIINDLPIGTHHWHLVLLLAIGVLVGMLLGVVVGTYFKFKEEVLTGITIAIPLVLSVLAGMMAEPLKQMIVDKVPWINQMNPLALISDAIYYVNHYPTTAQYWHNIIILVCMIVVFGILSYIGMRRESYESI